MYRFLTTLIMVAFALPSISFAGVIGKPANNLGLIAYWPFNEGRGTNATDFSGRRNTGTIINSPAWVNGKIGKALSFDGDTQYVDLPRIDVSGAATISAWIHMSDISCASGCDIVANYNAGGTAAQYEFYVFQGQIVFGYASGGTGYGTSTVSQVINATSTWYHVVASRNAARTNFSIYVNGVSQAVTGSGSVGSIPDIGTAGDTAIGRDGDVTDPTLYFPGILDEVRIFNRELSAAEVAALYRSGASNVGASAGLLDAGVLSNGLVGHWTFDGADFGTTITDRSGENNNGYVLGGATSTMKGAGRIGQAIKFDGTNDSAEMGTSNTYNFTTGDFSVAFWIKVDDAFYDTTPIIYRMENGVSGWAITTNVDKPELLTSGGAGSASNANTSLRRGVWEHVVVVRSGGTTFYYLNGAADGSGDVVSPASNVGDDLTFGTDDLASYIKESLDDVRMYNRALSAAEAKQLYNLGVQKIAASSQTLTGGSSLTNGLVGHWTMDGPDVTDKVYDRSGNSNNGYYYAGATSSAKKIGKMGQALNFSGSQSIEVSDHATLDINGNGTIAAWIKRSQTGTWDAVLAKGDTDVDADNNYNLEISNTDGVTCTIGNGAGGATILHSGGSVDTNWHHVACVWNGSTIRTYLDGVELGFDTQTVTPAGNAAFLGIGEWGVGGDFMDGLLDDVRLYNRALTPSEIKQLYNLGK